MKKNDLIKYLEQIEGNPEVVLWNGFVQDWMHLAVPGTVSLYKMSPEYRIRCIQNERFVDGLPELREDEIKSLKKLSKEDWQVDGCISEDDIKEGRFKKKKVIMIQPNLRGRSTYDRIGRLEY